MKRSVGWPPIYTTLGLFWSLIWFSMVVYDYEEVFGLHIMTVVLALLIYLLYDRRDIKEGYIKSWPFPFRFFWMVIKSFFWPFFIFKDGLQVRKPKRHHPPVDLNVHEVAAGEVVRGHWYYFVHDGHWYREKAGAHGH